MNNMASLFFRIFFMAYNRKERIVMIKWIKGFIAGISSVALLISFGLVIFYRALVEDLRSSSRRCHGTSYSNYHRERGEKEWSLELSLLQSESYLSLIR